MTTKTLGDELRLAGTGAAYIRVSTDQQDTQRQYSSVGEFEKRHGVSVSQQHWFKDEGWARDKADVRPDFQRLMKLAESRAVRWVVVDKLDRFGTKDAHQLVAYLYRLREAGCRLFDVAGKEWTGADIATIITAVVEGEKSRGEQADKSHRVLGGKAAKARAGEWQGGPVRLGFDVVASSRETDKELWRVTFEGRDKRLKVYADGRTERYDGANNFPQSQPLTEVLRVAPSRDSSKIAAAISVFKRYASESISFTALAHYVNDLGFRSSFGGMFLGHHVGCMLADPTYIGYYTWNRSHHGKFHRFANGQTVPELNYDEKVSRNDEADWVQSRRLFEPLVDSATWDAVQRKLGTRDKRMNAPRSAAFWLSGLVVCGNCGGRMVAGPTRKQRHHYLCGTYHKAARTGRLSECDCLRNAVYQSELEAYLARYLDEAGKRLEILTVPDHDSPTGRFEVGEATAWAGFRDGIARLTAYLAKHHPEGYDALLREFAVPQEAGGPGPDDFVDACVACYRSNFDPTAVDDELSRLRAEHDRLVDGWGDLPTKRAKDSAAARLATLDSRMKELEALREDAAGVVEAQYREMNHLQSAIADAKIAMCSGAGEPAIRRRAEALRAVVQRIECTFTATGKRGGGPGRANARLATVTIYPVAGESAVYKASSENVLLRSSDVSRW